jgi:uncharacterized membrane protein
MLYQPYSQWFALGYTKTALWTGTHTPLSAYLTHWGLFLFLIISWMAWETRDWMASTPLRSLRKLARFSGFIGAILIAGLAAALILMVILKVSIAWFVILLMGWAGALLLRPQLPENRRLTLFLFGTALAITLMVEIIVLSGDIGRMNTVFKFYLQAWGLMAVGAAASLGWLLPSVGAWARGIRIPWGILLAFLVIGAALFPLYGGLAKVKNRWNVSLPAGLDGMAYMQYVTYNNQGVELDLSEDYRAIRWMQNNISGSPVIVEAAGAGIQYAWFGRISIYTGLPSVVGWQWHQEQQRIGGALNDVAARGQEVRQFYQTTDVAEALAFLQKYRVRYIIVGGAERGFYSALGLDKFSAYDGRYWQSVYKDGETILYEVVAP